MVILMEGSNELDHTQTQYIHNTVEYDLIGGHVDTQHNTFKLFSDPD